MAMARIFQWTAGMRRAARYSVLGLLLALGAPVGLLVVHAFVQGTITGRWLTTELRSHVLDYLYVTVATAGVFVVSSILLARREDRLVARALTDPLTGLANRRHFITRLGEELSRAARYGHPLSVLFIDVDRLKQINDRNGHSAGDQALRTVGDAIRSVSRVTDIAARYGGDEFAVLAPNTSGNDGAALAERIRVGVRAGANGLSVSIGVADLDDAASADVPGMCLAADEALYRAKDRGRDRVERAQSSPPPDASLHLRTTLRHVYAGNGTVSRELRVLCPEREQLVAVETCAGCARWRGLDLEPGERSSLVMCAAGNGKPAFACGHDRVAAVMTPSVVCMRTELDVQAALALLDQHQISGAPVVGADGELLGVVSRTDLLGPHQPRTKIDEVMTPLVFALQETAAVAQAAGLMAIEGVHRVIVVSPRGELVGIVSALDVMRWLAERDGYLRRRAKATDLARTDA